MAIDRCQARCRDRSRELGVRQESVDRPREGRHVLRVGDEAVLAVVQFTCDAGAVAHHHRRATGGRFESDHPEGLVHARHEERRRLPVDGRQQVLGLTPKEEDPPSDTGFLAEPIEFLEDG